jgi:hypothetical protein
VLEQCYHTWELGETGWYGEEEDNSNAEFGVE